jgi:long-chain fatty acid transport protein
MRFKRATMMYSSVSAFFVMASLAAWSGVVAASGFALIEQSGSGLGNAYAGVTASAEDASTIFFNPAGMANLHGKQLAVAGNLIGVASQFSDTASVAATGRALGTVPDNGRKLAWIPNGYFATEITPKLHLGAGISAPFGSSTEYQPGWIGRYQALTSNVETINVNPSFSYQMNDTFSVGAGLDYQRFKATFTNAVKLGAAVDGTSTMSGSDDAWGYNLGGLLRLADNSRIGVSYRSAIQFKLSGTVYVSSAPPITGTNVYIPITTDIKTPDTLAIGYFMPLDNKWDVMSDLTRTGWSNFKELRVIQVSNGATIALTPESWNNTWRVAVGANYHYSEQWAARVGLAYDQSPVSDAFRTARVPDSDRTWLSLGSQYKTGKGNVLDFGYAHLFVKNATVNRNLGGVDAHSTALYAQLAGSYASSADILSVQYTYGF